MKILNIHNIILNVRWFPPIVLDYVILEQMLIFFKTWKTILAAHIILFNWHHEHATLYITARRHTHQTGDLSGTFLRYSPPENKTKRSLLILLSVPQKYGTYILSSRHYLQNVTHEYLLWMKSRINCVLDVFVSMMRYIIFLCSLKEFPQSVLNKWICT